MFALLMFKVFLLLSAPHGMAQVIEELSPGKRTYTLKRTLI